MERNDFIVIRELLTMQNYLKTMACFKFYRAQIYGKQFAYL